MIRRSCSSACAGRSARPRRSPARSRGRPPAARRARSARPAAPRRRARAATTTTCSTSRTISGARPSEGSSSISRRGRAISARPMRQHLALAARQRAGELRAALLQAREDREDLVHARALVALAGAPAVEAAEQQVVFDRHLAEQLAPLGHQRHAARDHRLDAGPRDALARERAAAARTAAGPSRRTAAWSCRRRWGRSR